MNKLESLETAYKKENSKVAVRMLAVLMILRDGKDIQYTAKTLHRCTNWVRKWTSRFEEHGINGLYDLPKSGRPGRIPKKRMDSIMSKTMLTLFTPVMPAAKYLLFHKSKISHNSHQKDNAPVWYVCKNRTKISYQSCNDICGEKLATTYQKDNLTPKREWIYHCNDR